MRTDLHESKLQTATNHIKQHLLSQPKPKLAAAASVPVPSHLQEKGQSFHQAAIHLQTQHNTTQRITLSDFPLRTKTGQNQYRAS